MSEQIKDGGPAFPQSPLVQEEFDRGYAGPHWEHGMSLRDYFAAKVLQAVTIEAEGETVATASSEIGIDATDYDYRKHWPMLIAKRAYAYADAMLAAREVQS